MRRTRSLFSPLVKGEKKEFTYCHVNFLISTSDLVTYFPSRQTQKFRSRREVPHMRMALEPNHLGCPSPDHPPVRGGASNRTGKVSQPPSSFGEMLYRLRTTRRFSQASMASLLGLSTSYYSELENSKRLATPSRVTSIASYLELSDDDRQMLVSLAIQDMYSGNPLPPRVSACILTLRSRSNQLPDDVLDRVMSLLQEETM